MFSLQQKCDNNESDSLEYSFIPIIILWDIFLLFCFKEFEVGFEWLIVKELLRR